MLRSRSKASSPCPPKKMVTTNGTRTLPMHHRTKNKKRTSWGRLVVLLIVGVACLRFVASSTRLGSSSASTRRENEIRLPVNGVYDVAILGCGPAGLTAAIFAARAGLSVLVLGSESGLLSDTPQLENFPSYTGNGPEWLTATRNQAAALGATFAPAGLLVNNISRSDNQEFELEVQKHKYKAWSVIVATGATPRHLGLPGETELWGTSLHNCAICDGSMYLGKKVLVVGGGDAAVDAANLLARHASHVILIHRRDEFRASDKRALEVMKQRRNIEIKTPYVVKQWQVSSGELVGARLQNDSGKQLDVTVDGAFVMIGAEPNTNWLKGTVGLEEDGLIKLKSKTETSVPGIFAAGEVTDNIYRQAITAAAEGAEAAIDAERWLRQQQGLKREDVRLSVPMPKTTKEDIGAKQTIAEDCDMTLADCLEKVVKKYPLLVFSKPYCPYCRKALEVLHLEGAQPHVIDLTLLNSMSKVQDNLKALTGRRTVPNVFVGGTSIGGGDETTAMHREGKLGPLLKSVGAL